MLFEEGDIPFHHDAPLDISCYDEIKKCHILVLIIGGRYGSATSDTKDDVDKQIDFYNSITRKEYETARKQDLPIFIFVEKNVMAEYHTYKKNRNNNSIEYAHVDNVSIFKLVDDIYTQKRNNLIRDFEKLDEIVDWLRDQWAGLFADSLLRKKNIQDLVDLATQISGLKDVSTVLKEYTESIMKKLEPENSDEVIKASNNRLVRRMLNRLESEALIQHIINFSDSSKNSGKISIEDIFTNLETSKSLEDFLTRCNVQDEERNNLINFEPAISDYNRIKDAITI